MKRSIAEVFGQKIRLLPQHVPQEHLTSVTRIGQEAFRGCSGLTSVTIPGSVTFTGLYAFRDCTGLKEIHFNGTKSQWNVISKSNYKNGGAGSYTIHCTDGTISK